ncbi:MAG: type II toxin-antitoxin system VapC family toxin [Defluviitaleaceae bacterium]|nr:type II toxin-antitoxin system VapC family toxin [Defluviitaleaceae bacterium]
MRYLLDTHVVLWFAQNSPLLSSNAKKVLLDINTEKYVSIISDWEVAIKLGTNKLNIVNGLSEFHKMVDSNGFSALSVSRNHLSQLAGLPHHHKDPFDRLLVGTALAENLTIITVDENIQKYNVPYLW